MSYEFVRKEEVVALWCPEVPLAAIAILNRLIAERDAAYEVAARWRCSFPDGYPAAVMLAKSQIEEEVRKLLTVGELS